MHASGSGSKRLVFVYEDDKRAEVLLSALKAAGVNVVPIHAAESSSTRRLKASAPTADSTVVFSRLSASAHTRRHGQALERGSRILKWAESLGLTTLNGSRAFGLEVSKEKQVAALKDAGLVAPTTVVAVGAEDVREKARRFRGPFYLKPDCGGSGVGVKRYDSGGQFVGLTKSKANLEYEVPALPPGGRFVLQAEVASARPREIRARRGIMLKVLYRVEVVDGRVHHLIRIVANDATTALCPCERKGHPDVKFEVVDPASEFADFPMTLESWPAFVRGVERCAADNGIFVGAFEFGVRKSDGAPVVFDVNTNTNYDAVAERSGVQRGLVPQTAPQAFAAAAARVCSGSRSGWHAGAGSGAASAPAATRDSERLWERDTRSGGAAPSHGRSGGHSRSARTGGGAHSGGIDEGSTHLPSIGGAHGSATGARVDRGRGSGLRGAGRAAIGGGGGAAASRTMPAASLGSQYDQHRTAKRDDAAQAHGRSGGGGRSLRRRRAY